MNCKKIGLFKVSYKDKKWLVMRSDIANSKRFRIYCCENLFTIILLLTLLPINLIVKDVHDDGNYFRDIAIVSCLCSLIIVIGIITMTIKSYIRFTPDSYGRLYFWSIAYTNILVILTTLLSLYYNFDFLEFTLLVLEVVLFFLSTAGFFVQLFGTVTYFTKRARF